MSEKNLRQTYLFLEGVNTGVRPRLMIAAHNIHPQQPDKAEWRVSERELIRWMRAIGFRIYEDAAFR